MNRLYSHLPIKVYPIHSLIYSVLGKAGGACLMTVTDRKSRFLIAAKAQRKTADCLAGETIKNLNEQPLHSITPDKGKEFANHCIVTEALG